MKSVFTISTIILFVMTGCGKSNQSDNIITVDVTANYPEKELILEDFLDVEYISMETTDEFISQCYLRDVGKEIILVTNRINDGNIFIFDRKTGKGIRKINRMGQGGEEYAYITWITLDEENGELFVNSPGNKILVYDLNGNFKRSINYPEGASFMNMFNYDKDNLICYDYSEYYNVGENRGKSYHVLISKQDGSVTREFFIPFNTIISPIMRTGDAIVAAASADQIIPYNGNWVLTDTSSDSLYTLQDNKISPFIIRTPSIGVMDTKVFLSISLITDRYYFMRTLKNEYDFEKDRGFPTNSLMYDKKENNIFKYKVYTNDYTEKKTIGLEARPINGEIAAWHILEADRLVDDFKNGLLKGKLKEIASKLDEESNPVIRLVKHRK